MFEEKYQPTNSYEGEPKKTLYLIYRDNQLFRSLNRQIVENLNSLNYNVVTQIFPEGTDEKEIEEWVRQHKDELTKGELISDTTFGRSIKDTTLRKTLSQDYRIRGNNLDELVDTVTKELIIGKENLTAHGDFEFKKEAVKNSIISIVRSILSNPQDVPRKVFFSP